MDEKEITWPEGWVWETEPNSASKRYSIHIECSDYGIYQSGGNEELWYVIQYWIGEPEEHDTDITGQCATLQDAIDGLRRYLAGEIVPDGDEIIVVIEGEEPFDAPTSHNIAGQRFVHVPKRS
jgi:hypothetical protein